MTTPTIEAPARRPVHSLGRSAALHLLPGLLFLAGCGALRPAVEALGLPPSLGFTVAGLLVVTPLQLWYVRRHGVEFTRRLGAGRTALIVAGLVAFTAAAMVAFGPVTSALEARIAVPAWLSASNDGLAGLGLGVVVACLALNIVGDCVLSPIAEELYYRGHLMPRTPGGPWAGAVLSAGLFAATHFWEPALIPFVFAVQAVNGIVVRRTGSVRVGIWMHIAVNTVSTAITIASL